MRQELGNRGPAEARRRDRRVVSAAVMLTAAFAAWLGFEVGGPWVTTVVDDVGCLAIALLAGAAGCLRARSQAGRARLGWWLLGLGSLSWGLGEAVWTYHEVLRGRETPFPSVADAGFLLAVPLGLAAIVAFFSPPAGWTSRLRLIADGLIVSSAVLFVSWYLLLGDLWYAEGSAFAKVIGLAYPVGDSVILSVILLVGARTQDDHRLPLGWVWGGMAALAVSDTAFAYLTQQGTYSSNLLDAGWFAGFAMLAVAALKDPATGPSRRRSRRDLTLLPYFPVLAVLAVGGWEAAHGRSVGGFLLLDAGALFVFVVVRQLLTLRENLTLTRGLEARVAERTLALSRSEERFRSLIQNLSDVISVVQPDGTVSFVSPSITDAFGFTPDDVIGQSLLTFLHPEDVPAVLAFLDGSGGTDRRLEVRIRHRDGEWRYAEATGTDMRAHPALGGFVFITRDVTTRRQLEDQLAHQAFHDPLTGMANRALFADRIDHALSRIARSGRDLAVVFFDLDDFKAVNDTLGHSSGDQLLREVAVQLAACVRPGDTVARMGGDEFAVLMEEATEAVAASVPERLAARLAAPMTLDDTEVRVSFSAGIACSGPETASAVEVIRNADVAMYQAKANGKGRHELFRPEMHEAVVRRVSLLGDLRLGVERQEFELHYQPLVNLAGGTLAGFEALLRWHHPERGMVSPGEFIPLAEETGLIVPLGAWALEEATAQLARWDATAAAPGRLTMSVNVSGRQLERPELPQTVARALERSGIEPWRLTLELTESVLLDDVEETITRLQALKAIGIRLAIDDFGTGFSSLSYLKRFPVDSLKVDKSFIDDLASVRGSELAKTMIELGTVLGLDTVAEGIEEAEQLRVLQAKGCLLGQGFFFSKPLPAAQIQALLSDASACSSWTNEPVPARPSGSSTGRSGRTS